MDTRDFIAFMENFELHTTDKRIMGTLVQWFTNRKIAKIEQGKQTDELVELIVHIKAQPGGRSKRYKRALPKSWTAKDLTAYVVSTGDLLTMAKAKKLVANKQQ